MVKGWIVSVVAFSSTALSVQGRKGVYEYWGLILKCRHAGINAVKARDGDGLMRRNTGARDGSTVSVFDNRALFMRGGFDESNTGRGSVPSFEKLSDPAPGSPFHYAFPVHDLELAKHFYGSILGCQEGRSSEKWQDFSLHGHQIVCHWVGNEYRCQDYYNPVDGDEVPVPHAGLALTVEQFHALAKRVQEAGVPFIIEPHLRFEGMPGEQWTMFFKDPSNNNLEFKAMTNPENLFAKYNVVDK